MMRLIDADALKAEWKMGEACEKCERNPRECRYNDFSRMDICEMLDDAPTVDAIPVEWLEELHRKACGGEAADTDLMDLITNIINSWHYEQGRENDEQG